MSVPSPWWMPHVHADRRPFLLARNAIRSALRRWFSDQGFVEVETACLQVSPGNEVHLHAFATRLTAPDGGATPVYLHTSPEFACKKLLAAGEERLFTFAPVFRNRELGPLHHPEFTMLEWYRAHEPYTRLMDDCASILRIAAEATGNTTWTRGGRDMQASAAPERITVAKTFAQHVGISLLDTMHDRGALADAARRAGIRVADDDTWSDIFSRIMTRIEPALGRGSATILDEYPVSEAALARPAAHDARVAERFELYACGIELANAFGELTDAAEQRRRFATAMAEKERIHGESYPIDDDFLTALTLMPPASGCALGFDRLVMLAAGASRIDQVMWTPVAGPS